MKAAEVVLLYIHIILNWIFEFLCVRVVIYFGVHLGPGAGTEARSPRAGCFPGEQSLKNIIYWSRNSGSEKNYLLKPEPEPDSEPILKFYWRERESEIHIFDGPRTGTEPHTDFLIRVEVRTEAETGAGAQAWLKTICHSWSEIKNGPSEPESGVNYNYLWQSELTTRSSAGAGDSFEINSELEPGRSCFWFDAGSPSLWHLRMISKHEENCHLPPPSSAVDFWRPLYEYVRGIRTPAFRYNSP